MVLYVFILISLQSRPKLATIQPTVNNVTVIVIIYHHYYSWGKALVPLRFKESGMETLSYKNGIM